MLNIQVESSEKWHSSNAITATAVFHIFVGDIDMGLSAPSSGLPLAPRCVVWFPCRRQKMPCKRAFTGFRGGPIITSWSSTKPNARSSTGVINTDSHKYRLGREQIQSRPEEKGVGMLNDVHEWMMKFSMSLLCVLTAQKAESKEPWIS